MRKKAKEDMTIDERIEFLSEAAGELRDGMKQFHPQNMRETTMMLFTKGVHSCVLEMLEIFKMMRNDN